MKVSAKIVYSIDGEGEREKNASVSAVSTPDWRGA